MTVHVDEPTAREFVKIISAHAVELAKGDGHPGVLQISTLSPFDEKLIPHRFQLDDVDGMVKTAVAAANAGLNVFIEARSLRADLRGRKRGTIADTVMTLGIVEDADHDKGKGGNGVIRPSLTVETSPGNFHYWHLFDRLIGTKEAQRLGDLIRASSGTDSDTGVITQCYRVAGTPNYPGKAKQARGRTAVEPTRIVEWTGRLWDPDELEAVFAGAAVSASSLAVATAADEASLPDELLQIIRNGGASAGDKTRSGEFHKVVAELKKRKWSAEAIINLLAKYPSGVAAKYVRLP